MHNPLAAIFSLRSKPEEQLIITVPQPCGEDWEKMQVVDDCHRHCESCTRTLTDFSVMSDDELMIYFKHAQGKICGRFRNDQLNRPLSPLAEKTSKANWWKAAMLLPFTLFAKQGNAQQVINDSTQTVQSDSVFDVTPAPIIFPEDPFGNGALDTSLWKWEFGDYPSGSVTIDAAPFTTTGWTVCLAVTDTTGVAATKYVTTDQQANVGAVAQVQSGKEIPDKDSKSAAQNFGAISLRNHRE